MNILGKKVTLRAVEPEDLPLLHKWSNDPNIWYMLDGWHFPVNVISQKAWFENASKDQNNIRLVIDTPDLGVIGSINLTNIDWKNNHAFTGLILGDKDIRGKGYGVDAFMAIERYVFEELHFERLDGSVIEYNETAYNFTLKCGWKVEGRQRNWYYRKNRYWDRIVFGITRQDYFELIEKNKYWETK
jgi:RimJ/RimL family protein N-acetyltransferase